MQGFALKAGANVAVAVSGGGDSMALALLLQEWAPGRVVAFTVDHGLRPGSRDEAGQVHAGLSARGIEHHILSWEGEKPATHIQEEARAARYRLLLGACRARGIETLALAHNIEDQAETFWMRLAHGSGLDGLAGMAREREEGGVTLIRPLLGFSREALRETCRARGVQWIEDPSNKNEKFLRPRLRGFEAELAAEGLTPERLVKTMQKLDSARAALEEISARAFSACASTADGSGALDTAAWMEWPREIRLRVLASLLQAVRPQEYPPRSEALGLLCDALENKDFRGRTLAGCEISPAGKTRVAVRREGEGRERA
jgi:tRNA(Ile)-lysidine synthase